MPDRFRLCLFLGLILSLPQALVAEAAVDRDPCPSPGTVAVRDDGVRLIFAGEDPDEPGLCLVRIGEHTQRLLFGFWAPIGPDIEEHRSALAQLLSGGPGTRVTISEHVFTDAWVEIWERGGEELVTLRNGARRAIRMERMMRLSGPTSFAARATYWIDSDTGVVLKARHQHIEGLKLPYRDIAITHLDMRG